MKDKSKNKDKQKNLIGAPLPITFRKVSGFHSENKAEPKIPALSNQNVPPTFQPNQNLIPIQNQTDMQKWMIDVCQMKKLIHNAAETNREQQSNQHLKNFLSGQNFTSAGQVPVTLSTGQAPINLIQNYANCGSVSQNYGNNNQTQNMHVLNQQLLMQLQNQLAQQLRDQNGNSDPGLRRQAISKMEEIVDILQYNPYQGAKLLQHTLNSNLLGTPSSSSKMPTYTESPVDVNFSQQMDKITSGVNPMHYVDLKKIQQQNSPKKRALKQFFKNRKDQLTDYTVLVE